MCQAWNSFGCMPKLEDGPEWALSPLVALDHNFEASCFWTDLVGNLHDVYDSKWLCWNQQLKAIDIEEIPGLGIPPGRMFGIFFGGAGV